jgi:hypothetical protein
MRLLNIESAPRGSRSASIVITSALVEPSVRYGQGFTGYAGV